MTLPQLKNKFNGLLGTLNGSSSTNFATTVAAGYEALALAAVMNEYKRVYGRIRSFAQPTNSRFLNQKPGKFRINRSFKIEFNNGQSFYFAADIEVFGLEAFNKKIPIGILFEADVVVIPENCANDVINNFRGYPAPQHIDSAYECKFGQYNKGQLRELLGLKRHLCYLNGPPSRKPTLFSLQINNSQPEIALKMVRPKRHKFFDRPTSLLFDLEQIVVN
ncbi:MAG: hypothetical protein RIC95_10100 [Vicingaceae bacterium]